MFPHSADSDFCPLPIFMSCWNTYCRLSSPNALEMDTEQLSPYPVLCGAHLHCLPSFLISAPVGGGPGQCPYFHLLFSLFRQRPPPIFLRGVLTVLLFLPCPPFLQALLVTSVSVNMFFQAGTLLFPKCSSIWLVLPVSKAASPHPWTEQSRPKIYIVTY